MRKATVLIWTLVIGGALSWSIYHPLEGVCTQKCRDAGKPFGRLLGQTCSCYCPVTNPPVDNDPCDDTVGPSCQRYCQYEHYSGGDCIAGGLCWCFCRVKDNYTLDITTTADPTTDTDDTTTTTDATTTTTASSDTTVFSVIDILGGGGGGGDVDIGASDSALSAYSTVADGTPVEAYALQQPLAETIAPATDAIPDVLSTLAEPLTETVAGAPSPYSLDNSTVPDNSTLPAFTNVSCEFSENVSCSCSDSGTTAITPCGSLPVVEEPVPNCTATVTESPPCGIPPVEAAQGTVTTPRPGLTLTVTASTIRPGLLAQTWSWAWNWDSNIFNLFRTRKNLLLN